MHIKQVHDKIKDLECDQCTYTCSNKGNLNAHIIIIHKKIKAFNVTNARKDLDGKVTLEHT